MKKKISLTIRSWHLYLIGFILVTASGVLTIARAAVWNLAATWLALCVMAVTGLGIGTLATLCYRVAVRLWAQAQTDHYNLDIRARQHRLLMESEDAAFEQKTTGLVPRGRRGEY